MTIEYIIEMLGYDMSDNIIKRCMTALHKVCKKPNTLDNYLAKARKIISKAS